MRRVLCGVATAHAAAVFFQAVLAGRFLAGNYGALAMHATNASVLGILGFAQLLVAVLYWRPGRGPGWPALAAVAVSLAEIGQITLGYTRVVGVHVPLGVTIIACTLLLTVGIWRRA